MKVHSQNSAGIIGNADRWCKQSTDGVMHPDDQNNPINRHDPQACPAQHMTPSITITEGTRTLTLRRNDPAPRFQDGSP